MKSTWPQPQQQPQHNLIQLPTPVRSALTIPEPGLDLTFLPDLQLLPPLCKAPSRGLSHDVLWEMSVMYLRYTAKEISAYSVSLCGFCEKIEQGVLMVKQRWGEQSIHQSCLLNVSKGNKKPMPLFDFFPTLSLPITHCYSHTQSHSLTLRLGQQRKSRTCGPVIHSVSLGGRCSNFLIWNLGSFTEI